jgi:lipoprotein-anchoring transpeptidase ErfK/SrfK
MTKTARLSIWLPTLTLLFVATVWTPASAEPRNKARRAPAAKRTVRTQAPLKCGNLLGFQVLLDRNAFSPGEITGAAGVTTKRALTAFQTARHLAATGQPDCDTWKALTYDAPQPAIVEYEITAEDATGPFTERIPVGLERQADLPALEYRSVLERLSERFHAAPALLGNMNRGMKFAAGQKIKVPGVTPFDAGAKPERPAAADEITIQVSRDDSALRATRADGTVVFFAPVTSGSEHDPLPIGDWKVTGVAWRPVFHYNPDLFWDAKPKDEKATLKAGPNNPVGLVWIALNLEHYGLHGTPEPGRVGVTQSHGCVRLTNWDAVRVAALVKPGTPVLFR